MISIDDFAKIELRAGKILSAEKVPDTDKLLKLSVDFAETVEIIDEVGNKSIISKPRQIVSGISMHFPDVQALVGRTVMFVTNLEPRTIRGLESQGMILAVSTPETEANPIGGFSLLEPNSTIPPGTKAK
jgi:methionyl-tRNA synthetase